jgi:hypothetical protein
MRDARDKSDPEYMADCQRLYDRMCLLLVGEPADAALGAACEVLADLAGFLSRTRADVDKGLAGVSLQLKARILMKWELSREQRALSETAAPMSSDTH